MLKLQYKGAVKMRTDEFIEWVESNGYEIIREDNMLIVKQNRYPLAYVSLTEIYSLDTDGITVDDKRLFDMLVEYVSTPIKERTFTRRFYIKPKGFHIDDYLNGMFLVYNSTNGKWRLFEENSCGNSDEWQHMFSLEELENLGLNLDHYNVWDAYAYFKGE